MNVKQILKNKQFLSFAGNMVMAILNLITTAVLFRHLSKEDMGCWAFFQLVFILVDTLRTGFLQTSFVKFYAGTSAERSANVLGSTWLIGLIITGIVLTVNAGALFSLKYINDLAIVTVIKWTGLLFITTLPIVMSTWLLQAHQRYMEILYVRVVNQASFILAVLGLIFFRGLNLYTVLLVNLLSCVLTCIIVFSCRWTGIRNLSEFTRGAVNEIYHFGKFSMGTSISSNLLRSSDSLIIKFTLGTSYVAIYNVALNLMNVIEIPLRSFVNTAMTSLSAAQNSSGKTQIEYILKKYAGTLTILFIPIVLGSIVFADIAVGMLGGGKYIGTPAANVFRIFMIFAIFFPIDRFTGVTLDVIHQPKINFYKVLTMLAINVVGDFAGIYYLHNLYGVALASIPTFVVGTLFGYLSLKKFLNFNLVQVLSVGYTETMIMVKTVLSKFAGKPLIVK